MTEKAPAVIQQYDPERYNVLVPTTHLQQVSPWHAVRVSEVRANPDPDAGDVFKVGSRWNPEQKLSVDLYSPAKPLLMRIAAAAGIVWNWRDSGPERIERDYVCYKAVGAIRLPDGSWQPIMARKEIDLAVIEEELREQWQAKAEALIRDGGLSRDDQPRYKHGWHTVKTKEGEKRLCRLDAAERERYVEDHVRAALVQWRKNKLQRAETGAMLRVIRAALGMRSHYTREELERPFVVPRIDFSPDYSDPEVRHALIQHGVAAMANLFAHAQPAAVPAALPAGNGASAPFRAPMDADVCLPDSEAPEEPVAAHPAPAEAEDAEAEDVAQLFGGVEVGPLEAEEPPAAAASQPSILRSACEDCGAELTDRVAAYSQDRYGRLLCYKHQPRRQEAGRGA